jgi:hypothetical protein
LEIPKAKVPPVVKGYFPRLKPLPTKDPAIKVYPYYYFSIYLILTYNSIQVRALREKPHEDVEEANKKVYYTYIYVYLNYAVIAIAFEIKYIK